jgi:hypothetical protein
MTTSSFLSHSKRLPRATGTLDFDIELLGRPFAARSVAVAAAWFSLRRGAITHAAASDCAGTACAGVTLPCQLRPPPLACPRH